MVWPRELKASVAGESTFAYSRCSMPRTGWLTLPRHIDNVLKTHGKVFVTGVGKIHCWDPEQNGASRYSRRFSWPINKQKGIQVLTENVKDHHWHIHKVCVPEVILHKSENVIAAHHHVKELGNCHQDYTLGANLKEEEESRRKKRKKLLKSELDEWQKSGDLTARRPTQKVITTSAMTTIMTINSAMQE